MKMNGKRIIITGASSGIGKQLAMELAAFNCRLMLIARNLDKLKSVALEIRMKHPTVQIPISFSCDVTKSNEVQAAVQTAVSVWGGIDALINNAGIGVYGPVMKTSAEDFKKLMDTNFLGAVNFTLQLLPAMKNNRSGCVVFISSVASHFGIPCYSAYSASKAALRSFSQNIAEECRNYGIRAVHVSPDYTATDFFKHEKITGGVIYHSEIENYAPVEKTARQIIRAIISEKCDSTLSFRGKILRIASALSPKFVTYCLMRRSSKIIFKEENNEKAKIINHRPVSESWR